MCIRDSISRPNELGYGVRFSCGVNIETRKQLEYLSAVAVSLPVSFMNHTTGLLGYFNGNQRDDLLPKRDVNPLPLNSDLLAIHEGFGLTCELNDINQSILCIPQSNPFTHFTTYYVNYYITAKSCTVIGLLFTYSGIIDSPEGSLFTYRRSESFFDFFNPWFSADFDPFFASPELEAEAIKLCSGDEFCLFDVIATGQLEVGNLTRITSQRRAELIELSKPSKNKSI